MNVMLENAKANHEMNLVWMENYTAQQKAEKEKLMAEQNRYQDVRERRERLAEVYGEFKMFVEDTLLQYTLESLMEDAINESEMDQIDQHIKTNLIKQYIKENGGAMGILNKVKGKTILLDTIREEVEDAVEKIVDKCDKDDPTTFNIDKEDIQKVMDKLNNEDNFQDVKSAIAIRVTSAEDAFLNDNRAEKDQMQEIIQKAQDKIDTVNNDETMDDDTKKAIAQEAAMLSKREMNRIRESKRRTIYDQLVHKFAESCMKREGLRKTYVTEDGKLNMDRVNRTVKSIYSLMECISTAKFEKIDDAYIDQVIASL